MVTPPLLELLRCPVCRAPLYEEDGGLECRSCGGAYQFEDGIPCLLDDRLPGMGEKRAEIEGWVTLARRQDWYRADDEIDAVLPFLSRDLGWDDRTWRANEHSFSLLLERYVRQGMRVLEVGAAKCWGAQHLLPRDCSYVGVDILDDPVIGLGRGRFYERRVGPFVRVQADGEHLPFPNATFDLTYCVATLHHALDLHAMVGEMGRVTRPGGLVCALNEGTRAPGHSGVNEEQAEEREVGINEQVHTIWAYLWAFTRSGLVVRRLEQAEGYAELARRNVAGKLLRLPGGRLWSTLWAQNVYGYSGVSLYAWKPGK